MSPRLIAAVDQGSSSTKGALLDADTGEIVAEASAPVGIRRDGERAEHDPVELLGSVRQVLGALAGTGRPAALGLACQRSTCLLWERASGRPLTPALSWQDRSAAPRVAAMAGLAEEVARRTGLRLTPYYAGPKLGRLLAEVSGARGRAEAGELVAGTLDAFLVHHLTGRPATEPGHAGRTLLYGLDAGAWDPWLAGRFAIPASALPELRPSAGAWGGVQWDGAAGAPVPLLAVAGDQQAALLGNGGGEAGVAVAHFGTGAFVLAAAGEAPRRHAGLLAAVTWSRGAVRHFQLEGAVNSAGSAVEWATRLAGVPLDALADTVGEGPLGLAGQPLCLPGFVGVGAPDWWPTDGAVLAGVRLDHDGADLLRAVLAGVAMRVVDCLEALAAAGAEPAVLRVSGRLAGLPALPRLLADASGRPVEVMAEGEAGLRGVGWLAGLELMAGSGGGSVASAPPPRPVWPLAVAARIEPGWDVRRRARERARWRAFAAAAAGVPSAAREP
jgi:glycerol kinase